MENKDKKKVESTKSVKKLISDSETGLFYDSNTNETYYDKDGKYKSNLPAGFHPGS